MRLQPKFLLSFLALTLTSCASSFSFGSEDTGSYYPSRSRMVANAAIESSEQAQAAADRTNAATDEIERETQNMKRKVDEAELKAERVESETKTLARPGSYSKVR